MIGIRRHDFYIENGLWIFFFSSSVLLVSLIHVPSDFKMENCCLIGQFDLTQLSHLRERIGKNKNKNTKSKIIFIRIRWAWRKISKTRIYTWTKILTYRANVIIILVTRHPYCTRVICGDTPLKFYLPCEGKDCSFEHLEK